MGEVKLVLEFKDPNLQALQLAHVIPFTITLDAPTDTAGERTSESRGQLKKGLAKEYEEKLKLAKADVYVAESEPNSEPAVATSLSEPLPLSKEDAEFEPHAAERGSAVSAPSEDDGDEDYGSGPYEERSAEQLRALARSRGLPSGGSKEDLAARLRGEA